MKKFLSELTHKEDKPDQPSSTSTPRWVKVFGIISIVLVLLIIIIMFFSGGEHGPGRHFKTDNASGYALPIEHEVHQQ